MGAPGDCTGWNLGQLRPAICGMRPLYHDATHTSRDALHQVVYLADTVFQEITLGWHLEDIFILTIAAFSVTLREGKQLSVSQPSQRLQ